MGKPKTRHKRTSTKGKTFPAGRGVVAKKPLRGWLDGYNKSECDTEVEKALNILYNLEDKTNYKIKPLGKAIDLLQGADFTVPVSASWQKVKK